METTGSMTKRGHLWQNFKYFLVAGSGLFGDGYLNITIGLVVQILGELYYQDNGGHVPTVQADLIKGALHLGMITGEILFGVFGDWMGRHKVYGKVMLLTIVGTLGTILMPWGKSFPHHGIVAWMFVFRFITGMGTGGDYPMTSSISAERGLKMSASKVVLTSFASIGLGGFAAAVMYVILLAGFKPYVMFGDIEKLQYVWRLLLGIGLLPLFRTLYARWTIKETGAQKTHVMKEGEKRSLNNQFADFREYFGVLKHGLAFFGVCACWFLFDIAFYGINLNQTVILQLIGYGKGSTIFETLWHTAVGNVIVSIAGYLPGYYLAIPLPDMIGRIRQQFIFSCIVDLLYAVWAGVSDVTSTAGLVVLFTLSQLFINMGPQATTFLLPVEVFPTSVRGTAHGIAAASGKCGAVLTAFAFGSVKNAIGLPGVLGLFAGIMFLVAIFSLLIPETKGYIIEKIEQDCHYNSGLSLLAKKDVDSISPRESTLDMELGSSRDTGSKQAHSSLEAVLL